jgi:hypothetical protein
LRKNSLKLDSKSETSRDGMDLVTTGKIIQRARDYEQYSSLRKKIIDSVKAKRDLRLEDLMDNVHIEGGYKYEAIARELMSLQDEGAIELLESEKYKTFFEYVGSPYSVWFLRSIVMIAVAVALVFVPLSFLSVFSEPFVYLRYFFGSVLVLFFPGFSLMEALFVKKSPFDDLTKYSLSFVMSLALVTLISLVLGVSPIGLETLPITASLASFSILLLFVAVKRRYDYYEIAHHFDN